MSPAKALRLAFARACEDLVKFEASVTEFDEEKLSLTQIVDALSSSDLALATRSSGGAAGLAIWDAQATAAFIEQFITGKVAKSVADERAPTQADAAILGKILDQFLLDFDNELGQLADAPPVKGFRKSGMFEDGRAILMAMNDVEYRQYRLGLDLNNGAKTGGLRLIFPCQSGGAGRGGRDGGTNWGAAWRGSLAGATAPVLAILHRMDMPLSQVTRLEIGTVVPIPAAAIGNVSLEGYDQRPVATGRLGQSNGHRSVKVTLGRDIGQAAETQPAFEDAQAQPIQPALAPVGLDPDPPVAAMAPMETMQPAPLAIDLEDADGLAPS